MTGELRVALLGGLEITLDGQSLTDFTSRKSPALLSYLMTTGRPHSREALSTLLWDESGQKRARASLRTVLWDLRQHVPQFVVADRDTVSFDTKAPYWLDVTVFSAGIEAVLGSATELSHPESLLTNEEVGVAEDALSLYRGDFMAGFHIPEALGFESWVLRRREWARQLAIQGWHRLVVHYTAAHQFLSGIDAGTQLLEIAPWQEETHRQLMRLLALDGQRGAALAQYESCCGMLEDELGVEPTMETRLLYSRIKSGKTLEAARGGSGSPGGVHTAGDTWRVPTAEVPLVGRDEELAALKRLLSNPTSRLAALVGPAGAGKTRLAWEVAERVADAFDQGVWFVQVDPDERLVGSASESDGNQPKEDNTVDEQVLPCAGVALSLARALGMVTMGGSSLTMQLGDYVSQREMLLVLDGFRPTRRDLSCLDELLQLAPLVRMLVVCEEPFDLDLTRTLRLGGLPVATPSTVRSAGEQEGAWTRPGDALALFKERARQGTPGFELDRHGAGEALEICGMVSGLPLAISLVAPTVGKVSLHDIVRRIERHQRLVVAGGQRRGSASVSLAVAFNYAWEILSRSRQRALRALTVFESDFDGTAAAEVARVAPADLNRLAEAGWLSRVDGGRFLLHPSVREAVRSDSAGRGADGAPSELADLSRRYVAYYLGHVADRASSLIGTSASAVADVIAREWRNIRFTLNQAAAAGEVSLLDLSLTGMIRFLLHKGWLREGECLLGAALDAVKSLEAGTLPARLSTSRARLLNEQARWEEAEELAHTAMALVGEEDDVDGAWQVVAGEALVEWGRALYLRGEYDAATERLKEALSLISDGQQGELRGRLFFCLGMIAARRERLEEAGTYLTRACERYESLGHTPLMVDVHNELGEVGIRQGSYDSGQSHLRQALSLAQRAGMLRGEGVAYHHLGRLACAQGEYERATAHCEKALEIARDLGDRWLEAEVLTELGALLLQQGQTERAWKRSLLAVEISHDVGDKAIEGRARLLAGRVFSELGMLDQATRASESALALQRSLGQSGLAAESLACLAHVRLAQDDVEGACTLVDEVLEELADDAPTGAEESLRVYLTCYEVLGAAEDPRARDIMRRIVELYEENEDDRLAVDSSEVDLSSTAQARQT